MRLLSTMALIALISLPVSIGFADEGEGQRPPGQGQGPGHGQGPGQLPEPGQRPKCPERDCDPPTKLTCFNLVCHYVFPEHDSGQAHSFNGKNCKVAARFDKFVTIDGGEVADDSSHPFNPELEVSCNDEIIFNNSARRFTNLLGTRIQGEMGPHPAITLPRGALHAGAGGSSGNHVTRSTLELDTGHGFARARGTCFIWTGHPLM